MARKLILCLMLGVFVFAQHAYAADIEKNPLNSKDPITRAGAARRIAETGQYNVGEIDLLIKCLNDNTRLIPRGTVVLPGTQFVSHPSETTPRQEAEKALVRIGKPAVPSLIKAMNKPEGDYQRYSAAKCLGKIGDKAALPHLVKLAEQGEYGNHNSRGFGGEIPIALAKIGGKNSYDTLLKIYKEAAANGRLNSQLFEALGYSRDDRFIPLFAKQLQQGDRYRKLDILIALGHTGSEKAVPLLIPFINSDDSHMRGYSRDSLKELGRADLVPK